MKPHPVAPYMVVAIFALALVPSISNGEPNANSESNQDAAGDAGLKPEGSKKKAAPTRVEPGSGFAVRDYAKSNALARSAQSAAAARADRSRTINAGDGFWGNWQQEAMCPPGQFVDAFQMRVEVPQGRGDDTALNAVFLACTPADKSGTWNWISSHDGFWGDNGWPGVCGRNEWLTGAKLKLEGKQGDGDDTAANAVGGFCADADQHYGYWSFGDNGDRWGSWQPPAFCERGEAICGLQSRVEAKQGSNRDDTALNGIRFVCCKLP